MAGDDQAAAGADEGAHKPVEREIAAAGQARFLGDGEAGAAGRVAGGQDDQIGVEIEVENLREGEQPIRFAGAEAGQQGRARRAFRARRGDQAVGGEMEDAKAVEIVPAADRAVGEVGAGDDLRGPARVRGDGGCGR